MSAVSILVIAVLAQPLVQRVEVHGGGSTFWYARGGNRWEQVRGDVLLHAQRASDGTSVAQLTLTILHEEDLWTVELFQHRPDEMLLDSDVDGPGGSVHAAVAVRARARVTRRGQVLTETAKMQAFALTTGFHADDGTFRMLPRPRRDDLELLVHLEDVPGEGSVDIGFDWPEIWLDGLPVRAERPAVAMPPGGSASQPGGRGESAGGQEVPGAPGTTSSGAGLGTAALTSDVGTGPEVTPAWNGGVQVAAPVNPGATAPSAAVSWNGVGPAVPGAVPPVNAAAPAPSAMAPWNGGVQAVPGTISPVNPPAAPPSAATRWNGGTGQATVSSINAGAGSAVGPNPATAPPTAPLWSSAGNGGGAPAGPVPVGPSLLVASPGSGGTLAVAPPRNGGASQMIPVTAGPPDQAGRPMPLVVVSPWNGGALHGDAATVRDQSPPSRSTIRDVPLADGSSGAAQ